MKKNSTSVVTYSSKQNYTTQKINTKQNTHQIEVFTHNNVSSKIVKYIQLDGSLYRLLKFTNRVHPKYNNFVNVSSIVYHANKN